MSRMKYICVDCGTKTATLSKDLRGCLVCWAKKHPELAERVCQQCGGTEKNKGPVEYCLDSGCPTKSGLAVDATAEAHRPSERCPRWSCYKEAYYLGGRLISCTDGECANYDKEFMQAVKPRAAILDVPMAELKKLVRQYGLGTITDMLTKQGYTQ